MQKIKRLALASAIAATSGVGFTPIAFGAVALEEVVVTARKREEVIQDVPVAITAVTPDTLERTVVTNFSEVTRLTPGFSVPQSSTSPTALALSLRGSVQNDVIVTTDPSVGVYLDGIYIARSYGLGIDMLDLEGVQVLKGPQGTLFGRNTTAGALLLNTKNPELDQFAAQVSITGGPEYKKESGVVNIPILDTLALRIALQDAERDDYITNKAVVPTGSTTPDKNWDTKLGGRESSTQRYKLRWAPTDALDLVLGYERFHIGDRTTGVQLWRQGIDRAHKPDVASLNFDNYTATDTDTVTFVGTYSADTWEVKFLASDRNWQDKREIDYDGGDLAGATRHGSWGREAGDQQSYEVQFNTSVFNDAIDIVAGALYFEEFGQLYDYSYGRNPFVSPVAAIPGYYGGNYMENSVKSTGAYTQATWHINDVSNLTVGLRYSADEKDGKIYGEASTTGTKLLPTWDFNTYKNNLYKTQVVGGIPSLTTTPVDVANPSKTFESVNWMISYDHKITDEVMAYGKVSTGFRAGGFNGRGARLDANGNAVVPLVFDPEELIEYELGFKGDFFDRRLRWNTAVYTNETSDKQLTTILNSTDGGPPGTAIANAGKAESTGFETELSYLLSDNFSVSATYAYIDAKVKEKKQAGVKLDSAHLPELQFVPQNQWSLALNYDQEFTTFKLSGTASYAWIDKMYGTDKNALIAYEDAKNAQGNPSLTGDQARSFVKAVTTDAYGLLNLNLTASPLDDKYSVTLWVKNALDERAINSTIGFISGTTYQYVRGTYTEPRTWGATVNVNF